MANEVFNRTEKKYIITEEVYLAIKPLLEKYMAVDAFSRNGEFYTICNIYFDTPDNAIIRRSIEKPAYKEKLRLRSYGIIGKTDKVYLEIKKKYNGYVNKRRTTMYLEEAYHYIETKQRPLSITPLNDQILNEIDYMLSSYQALQPAVYLSYDRNAMIGIRDNGFRITFDTNIRTRRSEVGLEQGNYGELLLPGGVWIMEAKTNNSVPLWFAQLLSKNKIYPTSFSKYGEEYRRAVLSSDTLLTKKQL